MLLMGLICGVRKIPKLTIYRYSLPVGKYYQCSDEAHTIKMKLSFALVLVALCFVVSFFLLTYINSTFIRIQNIYSMSSRGVLQGVQDHKVPAFPANATHYNVG